jgi:hypothetical protein
MWACTQRLSEKGSELHGRVGRGRTLLVGLANRQSVKMRCVTHGNRGKRPKPRQTLGLLDPPFTLRIASQENSPKGGGDDCRAKSKRTRRLPVST